MKNVLFRSLCTVAIVAAAFTTPAMAADPCGVCPADVVADRQVNVFDLFELLSAWGTCPDQCATVCASDLSGPSGTPDCNVDVFDLFAVLSAWGACGFDYGTQFPDAEAHQIALEMSLGLLASEADYNRVLRDLGLIRAAYPALADQFHSIAWAPNQLIVAVDRTVPHDDYECRNGWYGVIDEQLLFASGNNDWYVITLPGKINAEALAVDYEHLAEVAFAEPNGLFGGQNYWIPSRLITGNWRWDIDDGWHDCFDGCDCHHTYIIETDAAGNVILIDEQLFGQPWCEFPE